MGKSKYDPVAAKRYREKHRDYNRAYAKAYYEKNRDVLHPRLRAGNRRRRQERKAYIYQYLATHPCVDCGETDPIVLDFDHVRGVKLMDVSRYRCHNRSLKGLLAEIAKCDVRCANCHRRKTARERGYYSGLAIMKPAVTSTISDEDVHE